jgi:hypothetical protein
MLRIATIAAVAALMPAIPAQAHHGWSSYNEAKTINVSGPIQSVKWENPHGEITMMHDGAVWRVVLAPTSRMEARGLQSSGLTVGKTVTVDAYAKRDGEKEMRAERITVDGKTIELR